VRESGARENGIMERDLEAELRLAMGSRHLANKRIDELESALRYIADHDYRSEALSLAAVVCDMRKRARNALKEWGAGPTPNGDIGA